MRRFFIARNSDSDDMFYNALLSAGYIEVDHPSLSEFIVHDAVHPGLERYLDSQPVFITPHTPQSSFLWDGILEPTPVCCNFVYGEAGVNCMKAYGYPYRVEAVGFGRCEVKPFQPTKGKNLLIVPAHPSRRNQYPSVGYLEWVWEILRRIIAERKHFEKITLCWSEERIPPDLLSTMQNNGIERIVSNPWTDSEPLKHMIERIEASDLVMSCNTTGCVSVALGKPTVFITERDAPRSAPKGTLHPEKYHHFLKFPLQVENMEIDEIMAIRNAPHPKVEQWKQQNIGGNFRADRFIDVIREYIK